MTMLSDFDFFRPAVRRAVRRAFECPYCGKSYRQRNAPDGGDIQCCGEIGHVVDVTADPDMSL